MSDLIFIDVTDRDGAVTAPGWLDSAEPLHRDLRPQLPSDYAGTMTRVFASGGRLVVAAQDEAVVGLAVWRVIENTMFGRFLYVDDLVTGSALRSRGVGKALLSRCEAIAIELRCREFVLDSGVQRAQAHRFYFREGLAVRAFNFGKSLPPPVPSER
ncbi:MAG TPA: GNAT family N-acetyltransferase [Vicinamibacterales bacterium]|nr:GNAT family N-acetyltransferase [Vicinamibacterales bacterium]